MNDNDRWPRIGQAAASPAVKTIARHAGWSLMEVAPYHGLPLAAFLHDEGFSLLVGVTDGHLPPAAAAMNGSLLATRSDGFIVGRFTKHRLPELALGLWRSGIVTWQQPVLPWLSADDVMWLARDAAALQAPAYELASSRIRSDVSQWTTEDERQAGLARATAAFSRSDEQDR